MSDLLLPLLIAANIAIGGESDGTSDPSSARFDEMCNSVVADTPAPEAGAWFDEFTKNLVKNANPPLPLF